MRRITIVLLAFLCCVTAADRAVAQNGRDLFQQALVKERAEGDLRGAIAIYERITHDFTADRPLAADALVQLGQCYERLGSTEAERAYQRVVHEFSDQREQVARARTRLAALHPAAAATAGRGPLARRLLSKDDTDINDFNDMVPSPDGRRVAYTRLGTDGALLVRDLATGATEQLAPGMPAAWNSDPEWSPDGRRIAYGSRDNESRAGFVRIIDVATRREIAAFRSDRSAPLDWSPDGRLLLVRRQGASRMTDASLLLLAIADGSMTTLADTVPRFSMASFSPDGRFAAFAVPQGARTQIFIRPVAGGARRQLTDENGGDSPQWSPDGRFIAFTREDGIWVVPVADGAASGNARLAYSIQGGYPQAWIEGGLYLTFFGSGSVAYEVPVDPRTGALEPGGARPLPDLLREASLFAWSPDMQRIAFAGAGGSISIYSVDRQTVTHYETAHQGAVWDLWWSADGREVVWEPDVRTWPGIVLALDPATGRVREPFPSVPGAGVISLSADGSRMVYSRMAADSSGRELTVAPAGRAASAVVVAAARHPEAGRLSGWVRPRFSPQGDRVLYGRQKSLGDPNTGPWLGTLWVVSSDGTGARRLGTVSVIHFAAWDPTGRFIAYTGLDGNRAVLRVVEVATGAERDVPVLPNTRADMLRVRDWSHDGRLIGFTAGEARWEYWVVQDLLESGR